MSKKILAIIVLLLFLIAIVFVSSFSKRTDTSSVEKNYGEEPAEYVNINFDQVTVRAKVARTLKERQQGLSGTEALKEGEGMFFIFDRAEKYGFWMPDMNYAIDIIWLDGKYKIVDIKENATPESYPETFKPQAPALYVLEVPSGYTKKNGIVVGSQAMVTNIAQ